MDIAGGQIQGARRRQEDAYAIEPLGEAGWLIVVADGLGGLPAGDVASREAVAEFCRVFRERSRAKDTAPREWLRESLMAAHAHLHRRQTEQPDLQGLSTTLVALYVRGGEAFAVSVGDSYLMLLRNGLLYVLNELHREGSALTSCLGAQLTKVHAIDTMKLESGDRFLLASDGITTLREVSIKECLAGAAGAQDASRALLKAIEGARATHQDNATVVAAIVP